MKVDDEAVAVEDWWEHHHQGRGNYPLWLTGSQPEDVWRPLQIDFRLRAGKTVLNIGVGLGHCTRALVERGCVTHALDIAPSALAKVAPIVTKTWLASQLGELPESTFDVAISHLVAQHMSDDQLEEQLRGVIRALRPEGVFALQFAYGIDPAKNDLAQVPPTALKEGSVVRTLGHMSKMVDKAGGMALWAERIGVFPEYQSGWYAIHIARRDFPVTSSLIRSPWIAAEFALRRRIRRVLSSIGR